MSDASRKRPEGGKAQRVYLLLRDEILRGDLAVGSLLPGEHRLAELHDVSRVTIRRALDALESDGLVARRAGSGTVVRRADGPSQAISADLATLMPQLVSMGLSTTARLVDYGYGSATPAVAEALRLAPDARVQRAVRVRLLEGAPFSHLTTHVPEAIARSYSEADLATTPLLRLLERSGVAIERATQAISATLATPEIADALDVAVGAALVTLVRVVYDRDGHGVEHLTALYRPDRFRLEMTLERIERDGARLWAPTTGPRVAEAAQ
ncbi:GntR family transcriptional regulator [Salinarimonas sp. NSM]|uniref:GntR family transcriptional regulator n=1 Tax=Salinarimonas sp. NSM TaxID=3458003 RepID=UPI004037322E